MTLKRARGWPFFLLVALATSLGAARAEELHDLPVASGVGVADIDETACGLGRPASTVRARLVVRNTLRRIGPYVIRLPGYASTPDVVQPDAVEPFGPYQIKAKPGDTLRIDLVNDLADAEKIPQSGFQNNTNPNLGGKIINLHTHGLIVKPRPYSPCGSMGDYIFNQVDWTNTANYRIDIPERIAGGYLHALKADRIRDGKGPYPVGPYWIHSHIHTLAKPSVLAGQSAFLSVDCPHPEDKDSCPTGPAALGVKPEDVKILALRDLQAWVDKDHVPAPDKMTPDLAATQPNAWFPPDTYDGGACESPTASGGGFCTAPAMDGNGNQLKLSDSGAPDLAGNNSPAFVAWLYTVNGQINPNITLGPGSKKQLWRLANMSAVVTYRLHLVNAGAVVPDAFRIVSVDGVIAGDAAGATGDFKLGRTSTELLLMPGARAEVVVEWKGEAQDQQWTLETARFCTGTTDTGPGGCSADPWPQMALATVTMKAKPAVAAMLQSAAAERPTFSRRSVKAAHSASPPPANCIGLPKSGYRTIRFDQDGANFFIGPLDSDAAANSARLADVHSFRHESPPNMRRHVCVEGGPGRAELWLLQNDTDELHNFHIHQSKFRLATEAELAEFGLSGVIHDPTGLLAARAPEVAAGLAAEARQEGAVWHDSMPVPPRKILPDGSLDFGRAAVVIPFMDDNQIGTFVYHCHILEHEDGGMMATVEVYNPRRPRVAETGSGLRAAGFCGQPPAGYTPIPTRAAGWRGRLADLIGL